MTFDGVIICCLFGESMLNKETETKNKIVLSAENIIDVYQNEQVLWNPELNGSEEAKKQTWMRLRDSLGRTYGRTASSLAPR